jgi:hypothetical protein
MTELRYRKDRSSLTVEIFAAGYVVVRPFSFKYVRVKAAALS